LYRVSFIVLMVWLGFIFFDKTYTRIRRARLFGILLNL
jgi:hypothetical protein